MTHYKAGFKHTTLGWIPEEWEVKHFEEISDIDKRSLNGTVSEDYQFNYISLSDVDSDNFEITTTRQVYKSAPSRARRIVGKGDILMATVRPNLQGFTYIKNDVKDLIASTGFAVITPKSNDGEFVFQYLFSDSISKQFYELLVGSNYPAINSSDVKKLKIIYPSLTERLKIATVLSTWDEAITKNQQLIAQLQQRNKGLMQQLLTGKKRLKEFEKTKLSLSPINSFAKEVSEKNRDDKSLIVLSCTKYKGLVPSLEYFGRKIYSDDLTTYKIVSKNCFAYATNHIEEGSIGYQSKYDKALISPMYTVFKTNNSIDDEFLYKILKSHPYLHEYKKRMEGSIDRRGGLRWVEFSKIKVPVPSLEEQKQIAALLSHADNQIKLYEQQLATFQQQKKGLMQKLLTGEVRVKNN